MKKHLITMLILLLGIFGFSGCRRQSFENSDVEEESSSNNVREISNIETDSTIDSIIQTLDEIDITIESLDNIEESDLVIP